MKISTRVPGISFAVLLMFCLLHSTSLSAQQPSAPPSRPAFQMPPPTPNDTLKSVEVQADRHVRFRIWAPNATEVKLQAEGPEATPDITPAEAYKNMGGVPLVKGDQGIWETTIGPIAPGVYRYNFVVDGVNVTDPRNPLISESLNQSRGLYEVPGAAFSEYAADVPHGAISVVYYNSKATGGLRRMHVYTPPGYEAGTSRVPVLYLLHGGGDSDNSWSTIGRAGAILDNLIAAHKAVPMIVVMPAGHISRDFRLTPGVRMGHDAFNDDLVSVIVPYVDSHYRSIANRDNRALAGLSMGGLQTLTVSLTDSMDFAWVGVFSSGWFPNMLKETEDTDLAQYRSSGKPFSLYWVGVGKYDIALDNCRASVSLLNKAGIKTEVYESGGFHAWNNWRDYLNLFAPMLFGQSK
jgi:enterochelin esterase-like enzyme